jgi:hypothetical protein
VNPPPTTSVALLVEELTGGETDATPLGQRPVRPLTKMEVELRLIRNAAACLTIALALGATASADICNDPATGTANGAFTPSIVTHVWPILIIGNVSRTYTCEDGSSQHIDPGWNSTNSWLGTNYTFTAGFKYSNPVGHNCLGLRIAITDTSGNTYHYQMGPNHPAYTFFKGAGSGLYGGSAQRGTMSITLKCNTCPCVCASSSLTIT